MSADDQLLYADRKARDDALDVERSCIVQAPAGSGKTELLIQRYLRLLGRVDDPEEVLAITFTRKAAAEMRMRVLEALQRSQRGERPAAAHLQITADAADVVLERDRANDWRLIENPRRMRIQTLDSLNASIARMQPLTATGATAGNAIVDESRMGALCEQAAVATLDWLGQEGEFADATRNVLLHVDGSTALYIGYLSRMLRTRDQWLPFVSSGQLSEADWNQLRNRFEKNLEQIVVERLERLASACPETAMSEIIGISRYASANLDAAGVRDNPICALLDLEELPGGAADDLQAWLGVACLLLRNDGGARQALNKNHGFPAGENEAKQRLLDLLTTLEGTEFLCLLHETRELPPTRYSDDQWSVLTSLFRLLPVAVAELRSLCATRGITDHIDVALTAAGALGTADDPGDIALLLDYQVRHILVDEMQDTSKAQYRMLEALTGGWAPNDKRTLFCVGDPMQSIYRFRNAEVSQFLMARDSGIGTVPLESLVLRRNFRSGEGLVNWFNDVFPSVLADRDDPVNGAVAYSSAIAADTHAGIGECHVYPLFGADKNGEAEQGLEIIQRTLTQNPGETMAVLVRGRTHLPALLARLREEGIAYQAVDIDRLTDLPEIIDLLSLTRALAHEGDRIAWLGLLRAPWVGLDWMDIHRLVCGDRHSTIRELLKDETRIGKLSSYGRNAVRHFLSCITPFIESDRSAPLHRRVEDAWFALGGAALLVDPAHADNVYRYLDKLSKLEVGGTLADVAELESQLDSEHVSASAQARLQIMTMHKAKGLEFDHVLLYGLGRYTAGGRKPVMSWLDLPTLHGGEAKVLAPVGPASDVENDPIHQFVEKRRRKKETLELSRLLYVACTRARKSLHLLGHTKLTSDANDFTAPDSRSLLSLLWPVVEDSYAQAFDPAKLESHGDDDAWGTPILRRIADAWTPPEPGPVPGESLPAAPTDDPHGIEFDWVGLDARLTGTVVHRWLQLAVTADVDLRDKERIASTSRRWLLEMGAGADTIDASCRRVLDAMTGIVDDEKGQWLLSGQGAAELPLTGVIDGKVQSIVIDRLLIEDGNHWIVDYKTSTHEGGDLEHFLDEEKRRYSGQLGRYAEIYRKYSGHEARCALYFPLLQAFVEIDG